MAELPDHIRMTLDELRQEAIGKIADVRRSLELLNTLEARCGVPQTSIEELLGGTEQTELTSETSGGVLPPRPMYESARRLPALSIRPDSYLGETPLDAAKKYLGQIGHAVHVDEIAEAIKKGGAAITGTNWKEALERSLLRSVHDVIKVQDKTFGLIRFYSEEQISRLRGTRRQVAKSKKRGKRGRPKGSKEGSEKPEQPKEPSPEQIEQMKERRAAGKSLTEIGKEFGLHHIAVFHLTGGKSKKSADAA